MAVTLVQSVVGTNSFGGASNTATLPNTTSGNILVIGLIWLCGTPNVQPVLSTVADGGTNTFTIVTASLANLDNQGGATLTVYQNGAAARAGRIACQFAYATGITGKTSHVITGTLNTGTDSMFVSAWELTPGQFDQDSVGLGNSSSMASSSLTPSANGAFAVAQSILDDNVGAGTGFTAGSGYTLDMNTGGGSWEMGTEHLAQTTAAALTGAMTHTHTGGWAANQIIFTPVGGTTHTQSNTGGASFTGGMNRRTNIFLAA